MQDTLESLVLQNFSKDQYEIIVVDNGSNDSTLNVAKNFVEQYPGLIRCMIEDDTQGSYAARNKGINQAKGELLAFTDSDCVPNNKWLKNGMNSIRANNAAMVAGRIEFSYREHGPNIWEYFDSATKLDQEHYVKDLGFGATANLFVLKTIFDKYGLFLSELQSGGDYEFGRRLTQSGELLLYAHTALVYHHARSTFKSKLIKSKRIAEGQKILAEMDLLNHGQLNWRQLVLTKNYPSIQGIKIDIFRKILLVLINNFFRYYNFFKRI